MAKLWAGLWLVLALMVTPWAQAANKHPAQLQLQQNVDTVLKVARNPALSDAQKIRQIEGYADGYLHYQRIAALAVGRPWQQFSPQQKTDFIAAFKEMMVAMYARSALVGAADAQITLLPKLIDNQQNRVEVFTEIRSRSGNKYEVGYQLYQTGGVYKVYNIRVDGTSLVTVYRNQFNELIQQKGIDGTIATLRQKGLKKVEAVK